MRKILPLTLILFLVLPGAVAACGGFFPAEKDILQSGQSVIFTVDRSSQTIAVYMALSYTGNAEDFAWVVPVPHEPKLELSSAEIFQDLDRTTKPQYEFPGREACFDPADLLWAVFKGQLGAGGSAPEGARAGVDVRQQGSLGPYDYSVIAGQDATALMSWLRENGYRVVPEAEPLIKTYTDEHMLFVAMKLRSDQESSAIRPVKLSFQGDTPMLPLRFSAVAAEPQTQVRVWVFDQTQVAPEGIERILMPDDAIVLKKYGQNNYNDALHAAIQTVQGRGFVAEYAQPTSALQGQTDNADLRAMLQRYPFVTRLSSSLSPEQMSFDPVFIPSPNLPAVSNKHVLSERISPYACNGELLQAEEQIVRKGSPQALWIQHRWRLPWIVVFGLIIMGIVALFRKSWSA